MGESFASWVDRMAVRNGTGVVTLDWGNPVPEHRQVTNRLAGEGFRHWLVWS